MPKAFVDPETQEAIAKEIERKPLAEFPGELSPTMYRVEDANKLLKFLNEHLYYINVTLLDEAAAETTVRLLALDDEDQTLEGGGGGGGAPAEADPFPFEVTIVNQAGPSTDADVTVYPGTFDNFIASNFDSTFVVPQTGDRYLVAGLTFASGEVTGVSYSIETTPPTTPNVAKDAPPTTLDILVAIISDGVAYQNLTLSVNLSASLKYTVEKASAVGPGESPFEYWYSWAWT